MIVNIVAAIATMSTAVNAHIAAEWERWIVSTVTERDISKKRRPDISHRSFSKKFTPAVPPQTSVSFGIFVCTLYAYAK